MSSRRRFAACYASGAGTSTPSRIRQSSTSQPSCFVLRKGETTTWIESPCLLSKPKHFSLESNRVLKSKIRSITGCPVSRRSYTLAASAPLKLLVEAKKNKNFEANLRISSHLVERNNRYEVGFGAGGRCRHQEAFFGHSQAGEKGPSRPYVGTTH